MAGLLPPHCASAIDPFQPSPFSLTQNWQPSCHQYIGKGSILRFEMCYHQNLEMLIKHRASLFIVGGFPGGSDSKASAYNVGDLGSVPGSGGSPGEGNGKPTPVFLPGKSHGWRSLVGYCPWGHRESDTTERLHSLNYICRINFC